MKDSLISARLDAPTAGHRYPLIQPDGLSAQFTTSMAVDVASVLVKHGFPVVEGMDLLELQQALHGFVYGGAA